MKAAGVVAVALLVGVAAGLASAVEWGRGFPLRAGATVLLMWEPYPGATRYLVERRDVASGARKEWETGATHQVDLEAPPDRTFAYTVRAVVSGLADGAVSEERRVEGFRPLEPPVWVGQHDDGQAVRLAWEGVDGAAFYNLYRGEEGSPAVLVASVADTKHVDLGVRRGVAQEYRVRAVDAQNRESADSPVLRVVLARATGPRAEEKAVPRRAVEPDGAIRTDHANYRLREPTDLVWSRGLLLVSDLGSRAILVLGPDGRFRGQIGIRPPDYPAEAWGIPWGLGVSRDGESIVATFLGSPNVRVFSPAGTLGGDWPVLRPKEFEEHPGIPQPMDVAVGQNGELWVTEHTFGQVVRLARDGRELGRVGRPRPAEDAGPFRSPTFLTVHDATGEVAVVDSLLAKVFWLSPEGKILRSWGRRKELYGSLDLPKGLAPGPDGSVLIVDGLRSTLQAFDPGGAIRHVYFTKDKEFLDLRGLVTVAVDPAGPTLFALSKVDGAVYRLRPAP